MAKLSKLVADVSSNPVILVSYRRGARGRHIRNATVVCSREEIRDLPTNAEASKALLFPERK